MRDLIGSIPDGKLEVDGARVAIGHLLGLKAGGITWQEK